MHRVRVGEAMISTVSDRTIRVVWNRDSALFTVVSERHIIGVIPWNRVKY